jgi:cytosine/adenosine deaminase-related metal-dependent hydrolase
MKQFSAQFVFTNTGPALRRGVITADDDGTVLNIEDKGGNLAEGRSIEFYNGIIVPGFVNCHCHLELSYLKGAIPTSKGLGDFIMQVRNSRGIIQGGKVVSAAAAADDEMYSEGIALCADICNSSDTFDIKRKSLIYYINLFEIFGIDPEKAGRRMDEILRLSADAERMGLQWSLVPHSAYSVSLPLFRLLKKKTRDNLITSIHFMETEVEAAFLSDHSGPLKDSYEASGLMPVNIQMAENHSTAIINEVTSSGNLILVHNTFADRNIIREVQKRKNNFWCLCPNSNLYIENKLPPVDLLKSEECEITIGTDSLASNKKLSILEELKTLQKHFPSLTLEELIGWATLNGARALLKDNLFGKIVPGFKPGLLLLEDLDLVNLRLLSETTVKRLL